MPALASALAATFLLLSHATLAAEPASTVVDSSHVSRDGARVLEQSVILNASISDAWDAFTTTKGFTTWAAPVASVDLRIGGLIRSIYQLDGKLGGPGTITSEITAWVPDRLLAFRNVGADSNPAFDVPTFQRLQTIVFFESQGEGRTKVTIVQPGYGSDALNDGVYRFFSWGNRWSLEQLQARFDRGPINWAEALKQVAPAASEAG